MLPRFGASIQEWSFPVSFMVVLLGLGLSVGETGRVLTSAMQPVGKMRTWTDDDF